MPVKPKIPKEKPVDDVDDDGTPPAPSTTEMVEIPFRGEVFEVPKDRDDWDTEAFIAISQGDPYMSLKLALGQDQWIKLRQIGTSRRIFQEFSDVFAGIAAKECIN